MKNPRILLVVGAILVNSVAFGQDYAFKVLANKGSNEVRSGAEWQAIRTGASLRSEDEVRVSENAYLGLVHATGKPLEIREAGVHKVAELASKVSTGGNSVINKYTDFILSSNSAEAKKNRLSATGAVHRGLDDIKVHLPKNQNSSVYNNVAIINWESENAAGPYVVTLKNMFDDELMTIETPEHGVQVDLSDAKLANEMAILVEVHAKADASSKSEMYLIKRLSPAERTQIESGLSSVESEIQVDSPLNKLTLASFYEQNNLLIDAITQYESAIEMAPDVPAFQEYYEEFLLRNELKAP